uniref:Bm486 n=1 Tax=Brugia malayi TaxID=6279 RepID=A0A1I9G2K9_BRUMA|nr:Bm486 [Brugia malayi]
MRWYYLLNIKTYMGTDRSANLKRRARIISQLAANLLRYKIMTNQSHTHWSSTELNFFTNHSSNLCNSLVFSISSKYNQRFLKFHFFPFNNVMANMK